MNTFPNFKHSNCVWEVKDLTRQNNKSEKQKTNSAAVNRQGSGSEYEKERAGHVEGYGQPYPENEAKQ